MSFFIIKKLVCKLQMAENIQTIRTDAAQYARTTDEGINMAINSIHEAQNDRGPGASETEKTADTTSEVQEVRYISHEAQSVCDKRIERQKQEETIKLKMAAAQAEMTAAQAEMTAAQAERVRLENMKFKEEMKRMKSRLYEGVRPRRKFSMNCWTENTSQELCKQYGRSVGNSVRGQGIMARLDSKIPRPQDLRIPSQDLKI